MALGDDAGPGAATRTRRPTGRRLFGLIVILMLSVVIVALGMWLAAGNGSAAGKLFPGALNVNFGLDRSSLTRSVVVSSGSEPSSASAMLTARVEGDLIQDSGLKQFPADQITLTATPAGPQRIQVAATLSPMNPEKVGDGTFKGWIDVYTGSQIISVPLEVYLTAKSGVRAVLAFLLLLLGAVLGLSVKWITEALLDIAAAQRRFDRLSRSLDDSESLPDDAAVTLAEISDRIKSQDIGGLDELFKCLEDHRRSLHAFSTVIKDVNSRIAKQEQHQGKLPAPSLIEIIVDGERTKVRGLQSRKWPWDDSAESVLQEARDLSRQSLVVSNALRAPEECKEVLNLFQSGKFDDAEKKYLELDPSKLNAEPSGDHRETPQERAGTTADTGKTHPKKTGTVKGVWIHLKGIWVLLRERLLHPRLAEFPRSANSLTDWMAERSRAIAGAASVLVVAIVGLEVQYMDSTSFTGSLSDWLTLLLWAAIIELSGVSVLDVVGRLSVGRTAPRT